MDYHEINPLHSETGRSGAEWGRKGQNVNYLNRETDPQQNINAAVTTAGSASGSPVTIFLLH
jgi:hypothetical protein